MSSLTSWNKENTRAYKEMFSRKHRLDKELQAFIAEMLRWEESQNRAFETATFEEQRDVIRLVMGRYPSMRTSLHLLCDDRNKYIAWAKKNLPWAKDADITPMCVYHFVPEDLGLVDAAIDQPFLFTHGDLRVLIPYIEPRDHYLIYGIFEGFAGQDYGNLTMYTIDRLDAANRLFSLDTEDVPISSDAVNAIIACANAVSYKGAPTKSPEGILIGSTVPFQQSNLILKQRSDADESAANAPLIMVRRRFFELRRRLGLPAFTVKNLTLSGALMDLIQLYPSLRKSSLSMELISTAPVRKILFRYGLYDPEELSIQALRRKRRELEALRQTWVHRLTDDAIRTDKQIKLLE